MFWIEKGGESDFSKLHLHVKGLKQTRVDRNHPQLALAEGRSIKSSSLLLRLPLIVHMILRNRLMHRTQMLFRMELNVHFSCLTKSLECATEHILAHVKEVILQNKNLRVARCQR